MALVLSVIILGICILWTIWSKILTDREFFFSKCNRVQMVVYYCISLVTWVHYRLQYFFYFNHLPLDGVDHLIRLFHPNHLPSSYCFVPETPVGSSSSSRRSRVFKVLCHLVSRIKFVSLLKLLGVPITRKKEVEWPGFHPSTLGVTSFYADR